ncbi:hypothetical protein [Lentzea sp. NBRC 102530]|uniref:hypothetical protein n=1 Tax=Lentzea sp. NBRC 102530 TaxID=3032201 RepID=UPI0024A0DCBC|nr:hypothetical protein [Lentzea sp. NBRC 102530]GLY53142.1 hypothetical protein Lesp01_67980 [Lentzea sp. NBRC 102530]
MNEPTPEEAAAALRTIRQSREQVIKSAVGSRRLWIGCGLALFLYCTAIDLFPAARGWLHWPFVITCLALSFIMRTRMGGSLLGRSVAVSNRSVPTNLKWRLLRIVPLLVIAIGGVVLVLVLHPPHATIYYGALAGLYIAFLGPRLQLWMLRKQDEVSGGRA